MREVESEYLKPEKMEKGDLFRGSNWQKGKNHVFKEIITLSVPEPPGEKQRLVASLCGYWFYTYSIHKPSKDETKRLCHWCKLKLAKR